MTNDEKLTCILRHIGGASDGSKHTCPMHPAQRNTMRVAASPVLPGGMHITCSQPKCRFSGSALDLVEKAKGLKPPEAMALFLPDGPLYGSLFPPSGGGSAERDMLKYELERHEARKKLSGYFESCRTLFTDSSDARHFLFLKGIREDYFRHFMCGVPDEPVPDALLQALPAKDRQHRLLLPYYVSGAIMRIVSYNVDTGARHVHELDDSDAGIFSPEPGGAHSAGTYVSCADEFDAMLLLCKMKEAGLRGYFPVCLGGPDAAEQLPEGSSLILLSHSGSALRFDAAMEPCRLAREIPARVLNLPTPLQQTGSMKLKGLLESAVDVWKWIVSELHARYLSEGLPSLTSSLGAMGLSQKDKERLLAECAEYGLSDRMFVEEIKNARPACLVRKYGNMTVKRTFSGYEQLSPRSRKLSNFILLVNGYTGDSKHKVMCATVKTGDRECPGYDVALPVDSLMTHSGAVMGKLLWSRLVEQGVSFNPFAETLVGINWFHLTHMFDTAAYTERSRLVGVSQHTIRFPRVRINTAAMVSSAVDVPPGMDTGALSSHGCVCASRGDLSIIPSLLARKSKNINLMLGLLGACLYETARHSLCPDKYIPQHIVIPCDGPGSAGEAALEQLSWIFSGSDSLPEVPADRAGLKKFSESARDLNGLPVLCRAGEPVKELGQQLLRYSRGPVLMAHPAARLEALNMLARTVFADGSCPEMSALQVDTLMSLRNCIPSLTLMMASALKASEPAQGLSPVLALRMMAELSDSEVPDTSMFSEKYVPARLLCAEYFMELLGRALKAGTATMAPNRRMYRTDYRRPSDIGCWYGSASVYVVPHRAAAAVNSMFPVFDSERITREMTEKGFMHDTYRKRHGYWIFATETWDRLTGFPLGAEHFSAESLGFMKVG